MKLISIALLLAAAGASLPAQDLPQWVLDLARVKRQARANFAHLPDYACHQIVERSYREPNGERFRPLDTLHFEVAVIGGQEMYAKGGAGQFEGPNLTAMIGTGAINTGSFSALVNNLFVYDNGQTTGWAEDAVGSRRALRFDFSMSERMSGNTVSNGAASATTALRGSFWADASTFDLIRVEEHAVDVPPQLNMTDVANVIDYERMKIGRSEVLLPKRAEMSIAETGGRVVRNLTEFSGCRQYGSESTIHFESPGAPPPPAIPLKKK